MQWVLVSDHFVEHPEDSKEVATLQDLTGQERHLAGEARNFVHSCHSRQTLADNEEACKDSGSQLKTEEAITGKPLDASDAMATTWQGIAGAAQDTANQQLHLSNQHSQKMTSNLKKRLTTNSAKSLQHGATQNK